MRLHLTPEDRTFRDELRSFFTTQVPVEIRTAVAAGDEPSRDHIVTSQRILNAAGLAVPGWPAEWGGRDWPPLRRHLWHEEMQRASVPLPLAFNTTMVGPVIATFGSQEQKERFLPPTANLDIWWSQGFSEPDAGSDLASAPHQRGPRRCRLRRQRPEDLDDAGPARRLDLLPGPHRPRRPRSSAASPSSSST